MAEHSNDMTTIRSAHPDDLDFMLWVDQQNEGQPSEYDEPMREMTDGQRAKTTEFLTREDGGAWVADDLVAKKRVGLVLCRFRVLGQGNETPTDDFLCGLNEPLLSDGARFCEVFNLWVHPDYRRQRLATSLKLQLETESRRRGVTLIYTNTELANTHVIALNEKMGYRKIRQGPIWNDVIRVSLVKQLG